MRVNLLLGIFLSTAINSVVMASSDINYYNDCDTHRSEQVSSFQELLNYIKDSSCPTKDEPQRLCVVYDVDNTLLTQKHYLGSDTWSVWQNGLVSTDPNKVVNWGAPGTNFAAFEGAIRYFMNYYPTEEQTVNIVNKIKDYLKHPSMALTARDYEHYNSSTNQSLAINKINFTTNLIPDPTRKDLNTLVLTKNSTGEYYKAYDNGIYYAATDNKGTELLNFITKVQQASSNTCKEIIFIDNSQKNVDNVYNAFTEKNIGLISLHYNTKWDSSPSNKDINNYWNVNTAPSARDFYNFIQEVNPTSTKKPLH